MVQLAYAAAPRVSRASTEGSRGYAHARLTYALDPPMLQHDSRGAFLALSPVEAPDVLAALVAGGIRFVEDDGSGAGCAGPEAVVVRFPGAGEDPELGARLAAIVRRVALGADRR